ncbi:MAG: hypothetical protein ACKPKO_12180, partial [Candidatus Fonsibacter sp.]
ACEGWPTSMFLFWECACQHYCLMENVITRRKSGALDGLGTCPWELTHGEPFYGKLIPFGAKVVLEPSDTKSESTTKMEPTSLTGVFVGYELASGYRWSGIYIVWSLDEFIYTDLSVKESGLSRRQKILQKIKAIDLPEEGIEFNLSLSTTESITLRRALESVVLFQL